MDIEQNSLNNQKLNLKPFKTGFRIHVKCLKEKDGNCVRNSTLKELFLKNTMHLFYYNTILDPNNFEYPLRTILGQDTIYMSVGLQKFFHLAFKAAQINTDSGLIFSSNNIVNEVIIDKTEDNYRLNTYDPDYKGEIDLVHVHVNFLRILL